MAFFVALKTPARRFSGDQRLAQPCSPVRGRSADPVGFGEQPADHRAVDPRVLADVEGEQVETEGQNPPQRSPHGKKAGLRAAVGRQAVGDTPQILGQLFAVGVGVRRVGGSGLEPRRHQVQEHPVGHVAMTGGHGSQRFWKKCGQLGRAAGDRLADANPRGGLAEIPSQLGELAAVGHKRQLPVPRQGLQQGFGGHVRIAVHVAADPGGKTQQGGQLDAAGFFAPHRLEGIFERLVKRRQHPVEHVGDVKKHVFAFIGHRRPLAGMFFGLPAAAHLGTNPRHGGPRLGRGHRRIETIHQGTGDGLLLFEQGAPGRLGGVGGKNRLDGKARQQPQNLRQLHAGAAQPAKTLLETARLRYVGPQIIAAPPYSVDLFDQVDHHEVGGKGAHQLFGARRFERGQSFFERLLAARVAFPAGNGGAPRRFDGGEKCSAALLPQHLADQGPEGRNIVPQRQVFGWELDMTMDRHRCS